MSKLQKSKAISLKRADAAADIGLIDQFSVDTLTPEDVYCFSVILCDNELDRDTERFTDATLDALAPLFLGKTGISDHRWSAERQIARLYRVEVEDGGKSNTLGEPLKVLRGNAYMLNNEANKAVVEAISGGIMKEVSVGLQVEKCVCSICGKNQTYSWRTNKYQCEDEHVRGAEYDGKLCYGELVNPTDAFEFSFVAVPAQPGAGVTKSLQSLNEAFGILMAADLAGYVEQVKTLMPQLHKALLDENERAERAKILAENEAFKKKFTN